MGMGTGTGIWVWVYVGARLVMLRRFSTLPWYVRAVQKPATVEPVARNNLEKIVLAAKEFGLQNIEVVERERESGIEKLVVGTGRNIKHLDSASLQLKTWLKQEMQTYTVREGVFTVNKLRVEQRRAARKLKTKRWVSQSPGKLQPPQWVAVDTKIENISVHMMTEERRREINLAELDEEMEEDDFNEVRKFSAQFPVQTKGRRTYSTLAVSRDRRIGVLHSLCYAHESRFKQLKPSSETRAEFVNACDANRERLLELYTTSMQPLNESILFNKTLLVLLYRMHVCPSSETVSNADALANPQFTAKLSSFNHPCSGIVRDMLINTHCLRDAEIAALLLGSLAHANQFDSFWRVRHLAALSASSQAQIQLVNELAVALAVRSGVKREIDTAFEFVRVHAAPTFSATQFYVSDTVRRALGSLLPDLSSQRL